MNTEPAKIRICFYTEKDGLMRCNARKRYGKIEWSKGKFFTFRPYSKKRLATS